jgi:hypothetical protein
MVGDIQSPFKGVRKRPYSQDTSDFLMSGYPFMLNFAIFLSPFRLTTDRNLSAKIKHYILNILQKELTPAELAKIGQLMAATSRKICVPSESRSSLPSTPPDSGNAVILPELVLDFSRPCS